MPLSNLWSNEARGHGSSSSESSSTSSDGNDSGSDALLKMSNRARTAKAVTQRLLNTQRRKLEVERAQGVSEADCSPGTPGKPETQTATRLLLQRAWFTSELKASEQSTRTDRVRKLNTCFQRARCAYSFLVAQAEALKAFFARTKLNHIISINVVDDTNFRIAGDGNTPSTNETILNNLQTILARPPNDIQGSSDEIHCFCLHQPAICLPTTKGASLHKAFTSWLLTSSSGNSAVFLVNRFSLHMHFARLYLYLYLYSLRKCH